MRGLECTKVHTELLELPICCLELLHEATMRAFELTVVLLELLVFPPTLL